MGVNGVWSTGKDYSCERAPMGWGRVVPQASGVGRWSRAIGKAKGWWACREDRVALGGDCEPGGHNGRKRLLEQGLLEKQGRG